MSLLRGALQPGLSVVKKTAPFYSAVDEALAAIKRPKGTGAEFYTELTKQAGVKKAELADRKLEQAFKAKGKMTKEEAQQVLKENPPPKLQERQLTEIDDATRERMLDEKLETSGYDYMGEVPAKRLAKWNEEIDADMEKYGDYRTAGGQNYREILLKLPESFPKRDFDRLLTLEAEQRRGELTTSQLKELVDLQAKKQTGPSNYISGHWKEDPNVLAHMRVQDRTGANGEKILHVEEIQSDWHQEGRKKGYRTDKPPYSVEADAYGVYRVKDANGQRFDPYVDGEQMSGFMTAEAAENAMKGNMGRLPQSSGVPDAPFKKNWHELAMKRLLNYAADKGYDSIAITPGAEQAKRYDISKQISKVQYDPNEQTLYAYDKNGREVISERGVEPHQLADYIGKEPAEKLRLEVDNATSALNEYDVVRDPESGKYGLYLYGEPSYDYGGEQLLFDSKSEARDHLRSMIDDGISSNLPTISGLDLTVGGEGMKGFYDKILPDYLNTFGKPYNAQMGTFSIPGDRGATVERLGVAGRNLSEMTPQEVIDFNKMVDEAGAMKLHNFPITPEMRESIKQKGLPLYQQIGIPTAGAGAASQMPEQMQEPEVEPEVKKAKGGRVRMTTNRDTMFMELSNKKLKRK